MNQKFLFVSEDENDGNNLEPPNKKLKSTYNGNGVDDDSVVAGFNGTIYRPWTFEEFIEQRFESFEEVGKSTFEWLY